jgi:hypothetical protein
MRLNLGREIVSDVVRHGEDTLKQYLAQGYNRSWLTDRVNLTHVAVFDSADGPAYEYLLKYFSETGRVPSIDRFRAGFPKQTYPLPDSSLSTEEIIEMARDRVRDTEMVLAFDDIRAAHEAEDWDALSSRLADAADVIRNAGGSVPLPFRLLSLDDIDALPDPEILIDGLIDHGTVTKLVGESGKGKSFVAIDWSLCIATGRRWKHRNVRQGRVLYIAAEGAYGLKKRIRAWKKTYGDVPPDSLKLIPDAVQLADVGQLAALVRVARDYDVVVIDTLSRTSVGLEENSSTDMARYIDACYKIRDAAKEAGATVLVVHHTGYDTKRARGSSALFANGDGEILIESDDPHQRMTMTVKKRKDGEAGQQVHLNLETVDCGDWTSCVVREQDAPEVEQTPAGKALAALTSAWQSTRDVERLTGLTNSTADRALKALVAEELAESHRAGNKIEYRLV